MQRCSSLAAGGGAHVGHALLCERELALHNHLQAAVRHHARQLILHAVEVKSKGSHVRVLGAAQKCDEQATPALMLWDPNLNACAVGENKGRSMAKGGVAVGINAEVP